MQLDTIVLSDNELARIDPFFVSVRQGYIKKATLIFTNGKADPRWKGSTADGLTLPKLVQVDDATKTARGRHWSTFLNCWARATTPSDLRWPHNSG